MVTRVVLSALTVDGTVDENPHRHRAFRVHARRTWRAAATVVSPRGGWEGEAFVHDVSLGGACLEVGEQLEPGDRIEIAFVAPALWDPLSVRATVAWTDPPRAGVAFDLETREAAFALFQLVTELDYEEI